MVVRSMIDHTHLLVFVSAALLLAISPGPGLLYVLARSLRGGRTVGLASSFGTADSSTPFWQGVLTEILNPATALFFLAFIPQFINHTHALLAQFVTLGAIWVALNTAADVVVVLAASPLARR